MILDNIVIVEDEPLLANGLKKTVEDVNSNYRVKAILNSVEDSIKWFNDNKGPCLIFLDIQLADGICFSIFDHIDISDKWIVFTTAYDEYMVTAFDYNSVAYLLKPIKKEDIHKVFNKLTHMIESLDGEIQNNNDKIEKLVSSIQKFYVTKRKRILIPKIDGYSYLEIDDIAWIKVEESGVVIFDFKNESHIISNTLDKLEQELDSDIFFRANRQYIINIKAISKIENYFGGKLIVVVSNGRNSDRVLISRAKSSMFKEWLGS